MARVFVPFFLEPFPRIITFCKLKSVIALCATLIICLADFSAIASLSVPSRKFVISFVLDCRIKTVSSSAWSFSKTLGTLISILAHGKRLCKDILYFFSEMVYFLPQASHWSCNTLGCFCPRVLKTPDTQAAMQS